MGRVPLIHVNGSGHIPLKMLRFRSYVSLRRLSKRVKIELSKATRKLLLMEQYLQQVRDPLARRR